MYAIQGVGLEWFHVCDSGGWIRGVPCMPAQVKLVELVYLFVRFIMLMG